MSPKRSSLSIDVGLIVENLDSGDWKVFYHLMRNMDALVKGFSKKISFTLNSNSHIYIG